MSVTAGAAGVWTPESAAAAGVAGISTDGTGVSAGADVVAGVDGVSAGAVDGVVRLLSVVLFAGEVWSVWVAGFAAVLSVGVSELAAPETSVASAAWSDGAGD